MKKTVLIIISITILFSVSVEGKDLLSRKYTLQQLEKEVLIPHDKWVPFPKIDDRAGWKKADQTMLQSYIKSAEEYLDYVWPTIPATASLAFVRTGDRQTYEGISFKKRGVLGMLLLAEIAENKGRFVDQIIDGVWSMCEESWWGSTAHLYSQPTGLVDVTDHEVDLFSSETGLLLSWVDYYLGEQLDAVSPLIRKRIYNEVNHRIFGPFMNKYHWYMGESADGRGPNNWNPWICSNWINLSLLLEKDDRRRAQMTARALAIVDEFINWYPQDGGCDEGPSYWGGAASRMYSCFALLNLASNDAFRYVYEDEKIKNMARYIYRAQISERYFLNFADADPTVGVSATQVYLIGKNINDKEMMEFGAYYRRPEPRFSSGAFFVNFFEIFNQEELRKSPQRLPLLRDVWLPDLQVMAARDKGGSTDGFYVAAKGGHNAEAHNHNDVGSFVVYYNGQPLLIDVGRGTYTQRTFNDQRYDIWFNRSDYHNLPTVNGFSQSAAIEFRASDASYKASPSPTFSADIAKAYPKEAAINKWKRTVSLTRGSSVQIKDEIDLGKANSITQHIMTCYPTEIKKAGEVIVHFQPKDGEKKDFVIVYNPNQMEAQVEKIKYEAPEDTGVERKWGDTLHRINFKVKAPKNKDSFAFQVKPVK